MQDKPITIVKKRIATPQYITTNQLTLVEFDTPFDQKFLRIIGYVRID